MAEAVPSSSETPARQLALPRSAVRLLAACAQSARLAPELELRDSQAEAFFAELGGSFEAFGAGELRCAAFRASLVDQLARGFFARNDEGVGVSLWPMLGTRAHRLREHDWIELDVPPLAALRDRYLPARRGWTQLASCLCGAGQAATSHGDARPRLFVLDESVLPLCAEAMMRVLDSLSAYAPPRSELILAFDAHAPLRAAPGGAALELALGTTEHQMARYPRLRFIGRDRYPEELYSLLCGVNAVARLQVNDAPALAHLQLR